LVFELKLFSEGIAVLWQASRLSPQALAPLLALAFAFVLQEKPEEALPLLEEMEKRAKARRRGERESSGEIWLHMARLYQHNGLSKRAHKAALRAVACASDSREAEVFLQKLEEEMSPWGVKIRRMLYALSLLFGH
jgi:predicted Zn-dependent protease